MEQAGLLSGNRKQLKVSAVVTLILLAISTLWIFTDLYIYSEIKQKSPDWHDLRNLIVIGYIVSGLSFISFAVLLYMSFRNGIKTDVLIIFCIITGVISAVNLVFDISALDDISADYLQGGYDCIMEWTWLFLSLIVRLIFFVAGFMLLFRILKKIGSLNAVSKSVADETVFEATQYVGIVCGIIGIAFTTYAYITLKDFAMKNWLVWLLMFYCLIIMLPYFIVIVYWIFRLNRKTTLTIYDEKQKQDIALSGMTAWLASILVMTVLFLFSFGKPASATVFLWFPVFVFTTLLVFSVSVLLRFRKG